MYLSLCGRLHFTSRVNRWLGEEDSNLRRQIQSLLAYH